MSDWADEIAEKHERLSRLDKTLFANAIRAAHIAGLREAAEIVKDKEESEKRLLKIGDLDAIEIAAFQRGAFISKNIMLDILALIAELEKP